MEKASNKSATLIPMGVDANYKGRIWTVVSFCSGSQEEYQLINSEDGPEASVWVEQDELIRQNPVTAARVWNIPVAKISAVTTVRTK
jgi:hypothetical protein